MNKRILTPIAIITLAAVLQACTTNGNSAQSNNTATPSATTKPLTMKLADLNVLFGDKMFTDALKAKLQLSDQQIASLKKITSDELAKSKGASEQTTETDGASARAIKSISDLLGSEKTDQLMSMALERQSEQPQTTAAAEPTPLKGPN